MKCRSWLIFQERRGCEYHIDAPTEVTKVGSADGVILGGYYGWVEVERGVEG